MRIVPSRSFSPARIADFMSSVMRCLSASGGWGVGGRGHHHSMCGASGEDPLLAATNDDQKLRTRGAEVKSRVLRFWWRFTAAAFLRLRSCVGFS